MTQSLRTLVWDTAWSARSPTKTTSCCSRSTPTPEKSPPQKQVTRSDERTYVKPHRRTELGAASVGKSIICPSLSAIWRYSASVNPDYTAHLACSRLTLIVGRRQNVARDVDHRLLWVRVWACEWVGLSCWPLMHIETCGTMISDIQCACVFF